jgi:aerobic-type carbon monoxide dehydrogenase small subunit (CoxS/CutS family)
MSEHQETFNRGVEEGKRQERERIIKILTDNYTRDMTYQNMKKLIKEIQEGS